MWLFEDLVNMDKHCGVIRYFQKKRLALKEIHVGIVATLGHDAPALSIAKKWAAEFSRGRQSREDNSRSGRHSIAITQENIEYIH